MNKEQVLRILEDAKFSDEDGVPEIQALGRYSWNRALTTAISVVREIDE